MSTKKVQNNILLMAGLAMWLMSCSTVERSEHEDEKLDGIVQKLRVADVANSECGSMEPTRAYGAPRQVLRLERHGNRIDGTFRNRIVNCAYGSERDVNVTCEEHEQTLNIGVDEGLGDVQANCYCTISIYFSIYDADRDTYILKVDGQDLGLVSFKNHDAVEIDLDTQERAYDEGFRDKVAVYRTRHTEGTAEKQGDGQHWLTLQYDYVWHQLSVDYTNLAVPGDFVDVVVTVDNDADNVLVIEPRVEGGNKTEGQVYVGLGATLANVKPQTYHLKLSGFETDLTFGKGERNGLIVDMDSMTEVPFDYWSR